MPCIRASATGPWASMSFSVFLSSVHCYAVVLNTPDPKPNQMEGLSNSFRADLAHQLYRILVFWGCSKEQGWRFWIWSWTFWAWDRDFGTS